MRVQFDWGYFEPDMSGIREILHSDGVQAALASEAAGIASELSAAARAELHGEVAVDPYRSQVNQGRYTSIGIVGTGSVFGERDHLKHDRLSAYVDKK